MLGNSQNTEIVRIPVRVFHGPLRVKHGPHTGGYFRYVPGTDPVRTSTYPVRILGISSKILWKSTKSPQNQVVGTQKWSKMIKFSYVSIPPKPVPWPQLMKHQSSCPQIQLECLKPSAIAMRSFCTKQCWGMHRVWIKPEAKAFEFDPKRSKAFEIVENIPQVSISKQVNQFWNLNHLAVCQRSIRPSDVQATYMY